MIELRNVSAGYLSETVLPDLTISFGKGELSGIFGPNGAGKTTLLCAINGLAGVRKGSVLIGGVPFSSSTSAGLRRKIGYVPQLFEIDSRAPVLAGEVVLMGAYGRTGVLRPAGKEKNKVESLAEKLRITGLINRPFGQLSGGEKQKTLIARAIIQEPEILLLDEIFAWVDERMQEELLEFISGLHRDSNLTTLMVSHNPRFVSRIITRAVRLEEGRVVFDGKPENLVPEPCCRN